MSARGIGLVPGDPNEVQWFVGLCSYYRRHIQYFTELAAPLYELTTKRADFEWMARWDEAFVKLQTAVTIARVLGFPREEGQWYLDTDTSDVGPELFCHKLRMVRNGTCLCQQVMGRE